MKRGEWVQCNACGGTYQPLQADGTEYYHACPDRRMVQPAEVDEATGLVVKPAVVEKIPNRRDENVASIDTDGKVVIKSEGAGVTPIAAPALVDSAL